MTNQSKIAILLNSFLNIKIYKEIKMTELSNVTAEQPKSPVDQEAIERIGRIASSQYLEHGRASAQLERVEGTYTKVTRKAQNTYDDNLELSAAHFKQNEGEYIEAAKQDAYFDGVEIKD